MGISRLGYVLKNPDISINMRFPVMTYGMETIALTAEAANKLRITQRAIERTMWGISIRGRIRNDV